MSQSYNPSYALLHNWFGLFRVRSPLLAESLLFSSPKGTQMCQFPSFASHLSGITQLHCAGFPHSDILGSKVICTSPKLFAAYHVLHRLPEPRHPPFALNLLFSIFIFARLFFLIVQAHSFQSAMYTLSYRIASTTLLFSFFQYVKELYLVDS